MTKINYYSIRLMLGNGNAVNLKCDGVNDKFTFNEVSDYMATYLRNFRNNGKKISFLWSEHNLPKDLKQNKTKNQRRLMHYYIIQDTQQQLHLTFVKAS